MKRADAVTPGLERSLAVVQRNLFRTASPLASVGRFDIVRTLGSGGMGVVYEATDREHHERVALKMLNGCGPSELYRLKREFRSLAAISHANLVALHELHVCDENAFFTMELVVGSDLLSHLSQRCSGCAADDADRLRDILIQLCRGLMALHGEGKVHSDLKPSNVLVTDQGRVVLVDFGMASELAERSAEIAGTPRYMAPERFSGEVSEASDWYSFGRTLQQVLAQSRRIRSADGYIERLAALAHRLLHEDPTQRPRGQEVLSTVAGTHERAQRTREPHSAMLVGRAAELADLNAALLRSRKRPGIFVLRGAAGVGKTALMTHFASGCRERGHAFVISGRCYQHEYVAFKAFDGLIDELSRQLTSGAEPWLSQLSGEERIALLQLFPVLGRVLQPPDSCESREALHPVAARNRGFRALKRLLGLIARDRPVLLCIDDLHWSDEDSASLLGCLVCDEDSPLLLVVATDRTPDGSSNPITEELARASAQMPRPPECTERTLANLAHAETLVLAQRLTRRAAHGANDVARLAVASMGSPLLLIELLRARDVQLPAQNGLDTDGELPFDALINARMDSLSAPARALLCLVAIAGRPIAEAVVEQALALGHAQHGVVRELCRARLIRASRRGADTMLTVEHDRLGEAVLRTLSPEHRHGLHARLADALDTHDAFAAEGSLAQYLAAGLREQAAERARQAGELALAALAFARAAWLFERALELGNWSAPVRMHLYTELATAHAHAGKGLLAGTAYLEAARHCPDCFERVHLQALAAEHFVLYGRYEQGALLLKGCYELLDLRWPKRRVELISRLVVLLVFAEVSGLVRRRAQHVTARHHARARLFALAGTCFEGFDDERALYNALLMLREAENSPEPVLRARAQGLRGLLRAAGLLRGGSQRGLRDLRTAWQLASTRGELSASIDIQRQLAASHFMHGDAAGALRWGLDCAADLRLHPLPPRDLYRVLGMIVFSLWALGEIKETASAWREFSDMARNQTDAATNVWVHAGAMRFVLSLAADDSESARAMLQHQEQVCAQYPGYRFMRWIRAYCLAERALYFHDSRRALRDVEAQHRILSRMRYPLLSAYGDLLLTRALLAAASEATPALRRRLLRRATWAILRLRLVPRQEPVRSHLEMLRAGLEMLRGHRSRALDRVRRALASYETRGAKLAAASARYQLGVMLQDRAGDELRARALAVLDAEGIVNRERWLRWSLPGFDIVGESRGS